MIVSYLFFHVVSIRLLPFCVFFPEVRILPVQQLARVLLLALVSDWSSVLRSERRWALVFHVGIVIFCRVSLFFYWKALLIPCSQFFQKLEEKIHAKELEQTNLQEKSKVGVAFMLFANKKFGIFVCFSTEINLYTIRRAKRLRSNFWGRAWHLKRHQCQAFTRSSHLKSSWKRYWVDWLDVLRLLYIF